MKRKLQFAGWLMALGMGAALAVPCFAQGPRVNGAPNRQGNAPPKQRSQQPPPRQQQPPRQEQRPEHRQQQESRRAENERQNSSTNRPPHHGVKRQTTAHMNRAPTAVRPH